MYWKRNFGFRLCHHSSSRISKTIYFLDSVASGRIKNQKKYDEKYTSLNYIYNTHTDTFKYVGTALDNQVVWPPTLIWPLKTVSG